MGMTLLRTGVQSWRGTEGGQVGKTVKKIHFFFGKTGSDVRLD